MSGRTVGLIAAVLTVAGAAVLTVAGCDDCGSARKTAADAAATVATPKPSTASSRSIRSEPDIDLRSEAGFAAAHRTEASLQGDRLQLPNHAAYLSLPLGQPPPLPAVLLLHGRQGLDRHARLLADRVAAEGYGALAVAWIASEGAPEPPLPQESPEQAEEQAQGALAEALRFVRRDPRLHAEHAAVLAWDRGTISGLEFALHEPTLAAVVLYDGPPSGDPESLADLNCPLLALFGTKDSTLPDRAIDRFEMGLEQATDKRYRVVRLPAGHDFADPSAEGYDPIQAAQAWSVVQAFLREHLAEAQEDHG